MKEKNANHECISITKQTFLIVWWLLKAPSQDSGRSCAPLLDVFERKYRARMILEILFILKKMHNSFIWNGSSKNLNQ